MKAYELRAILSRIDPNAEVFVTSGDPKGHGSFALPVTGVGQDRVELDPNNAPSSALVLHFTHTGRKWVAKAHAKDAGQNTKVQANVRFMGGPPGLLCVRKHVSWAEAKNRLEYMRYLWGVSYIDVVPEKSIEAGDWERLTFKNRDELGELIGKITDLQVVDIILV